MAPPGFLGGEIDHTTFTQYNNTHDIPIRGTLPRYSQSLFTSPPDPSSRQASDSQQCHEPLLHGAPPTQSPASDLTEPSQGTRSYAYVQEAFIPKEFSNVGKRQGAEILKYRDWDIVVPEDLSSNSKMLVEVQQAAIHQGAVYAVKEATLVFLLACTSGTACVQVNLPPTTRDKLSLDYSPLSLVEADGFVVAGAFLVAPDVCINIRAQESDTDLSHLQAEFQLFLDSLGNNRRKFRPLQSYENSVHQVDRSHPFYKTTPEANVPAEELIQENERHMQSAILQPSYEHNPGLRTDSGHELSQYVEDPQSSRIPLNSTLVHEQPYPPLQDDVPSNYIEGRVRAKHPSMQKSTTLIAKEKKKEFSRTYRQKRKQEMRELAKRCEALEQENQRRVELLSRVEENGD